MIDIVTEGVEGVYHGAHAISDLMDGNTDGAIMEGGQALWHGGMSILNAFDPEAGETAEGIKTLAEGGIKAYDHFSGADEIPQSMNMPIRPGALKNLGGGGAMPAMPSGPGAGMQYDESNPYLCY
jgi:hypothetical protein